MIMISGTQRDIYGAHKVPLSIEIFYRHEVTMSEVEALNFVIPEIQSFTIFL